jgi:hypothetical protein
MLTSLSKNFYVARGFEDSYIVAESKVCAWLQDEVLQRIMEPRKPRGWRTKLPRAKIEAPRAIDEGQEESQLGSGSEGEGEERVGKLLTYQTVRGYINAISLHVNPPCKRVTRSGTVVPSHKTHQESKHQ